MSSVFRAIERFLSFKRIPLRVILLTAGLSYAIQIALIIQDQPWSIVAVGTLLPWLPIVLFEGIWRVEHYHWIAVLGVVLALQVGYVAELTSQVGALALANGTLVCPPPVDTGINAAYAVDARLRDPANPATGLAATRIVQPNENGFPTYVAGSNDFVIGPPACGIFGQFDLESVRLLWGIVGWLLLLVLLRQFPRNLWLWLAMVLASILAVDALFVAASALIDTAPAYTGTFQYWSTLYDPATGVVTAVPLGQIQQTMDFHAAAGQYGLFARDGALGTLIPALNASLPPRIWFDFIFSLLVTLPLAVAAIIEGRKLYDYYLAQALPSLSREALVQATPMLERAHYSAGDIIIRQGDPATEFFIISSGKVDVVHEDDPEGETYLATLEPGQYFGEIGLLEHSPRIATVRAQTDVEVLKLDALEFSGLMQQSEMSQREIARVMRSRAEAVAAV